MALRLDDELVVPDALCSWLDEFCEPLEPAAAHAADAVPEEANPRGILAPVEVIAAGDGWAASAAASLHDSGFCVLRALPGAPPLVPEAATGACRKYIEQRLARLMSLAREHGVDPRSDRFTYGELCARTPGGRRLDMRLPHHPRACDDCPPEWSSLLASIDRWVRPVVAAASSLCSAGPSGVRVDSAGCVTALPGAPAQHFHPDGTVRGLLNVFAPLVRVDASNGSTEFRPRTHLWQDGAGAEQEWDERRGDVAAAPSLDPSELLLFDYRVMHRGRTNATADPRHIAYVVYAARPGICDAHNFPRNEWLLESSRAELLGEGEPIVA
jgi:hypothetical protein